MLDVLCRRGGGSAVRVFGGPRGGGGSSSNPECRNIKTVQRFGKKVPVQSSCGEVGTWGLRELKHFSLKTSLKMIYTRKFRKIEKIFEGFRVVLLQFCRII